MTDAAAANPLRTVVLKTSAVIRNAWHAAGSEVQILESDFHSSVHTPVGWTPAPQPSATATAGAAPAQPTSGAFAGDAEALANLAGNLAQRAHNRIDDLDSRLLNAVRRLEILESAAEKPTEAASPPAQPPAPAPAPEQPPPAAA